MGWDVGGAGVQKDAGELQLHVVEGILLCCAVLCCAMLAGCSLGLAGYPSAAASLSDLSQFLVAYIPPLSLILLI